MAAERRLSDNAALQLTLGVHLGLLVLLAAWHRYSWAGPFSNSFIDFQLALFGGVFLGQVALVGCWVASSRSAVVLRCTVFSLALPLLAAVQAQVFCHGGALLWWLGSTHDSRLRLTIWVVELFVFATGIVLGGIGLRSAGWRLEVPGAADEVIQSPSKFRLIELLGWVGLVAVVLGAGRWLAERGWTWQLLIVAAEQVLLEEPWIVRLEFGGLALCLAAAVFRGNSIRWTFGVLVLAPLALTILDKLWLRPWIYGAGESVDGSHRALPPDFMAALYYVFATTFAGTLLVLRDRGYRLVWRNPWPSRRAG